MENNLGTFHFINEDIKEIDISGEYIKIFKEIYYKKIKDRDGINAILNNSINILSKCIDNLGNPNSKTGIVVGKVQSGKTSNFLGLLSLAFDNNYNFAIVIGGKDKDLLLQNEIRIKEVFENSINNKNKCRVITSENYVSNQVEEWMKNNESRKLIITCLKNKKHLEKLYKIFNKSSYLKNQKIMIIDDEGDQYSLNSNYNTNKTEPTTLYQQIIELKKLLKYHSYISITATPYANLLINKFDDLSPSFIITIKPGKGYTGLDLFHGEENSSKYIRKLDEHEVWKLDEKDVDPTETKSFERALSTFFVGSALKQILFDDEEDISEMLIHSERENNQQAKILESINRKIKLYKENLKLKSEGKYLKNIRYKSYLEFINLGFKEYFDRELDINNIRDNEILEIINSRVNQTETQIKNSTNKVNRNSFSKPLNPNIIYIGADLVERGITFSNLLVTFITRRAKSTTNADTTLQRARWFGYREKFLQYIRIFCKDSIDENFKKILIAEEALWFELKEWEKNDNCLKEWRVRAIKLEKDIRPTRKGVAKFELTCLVSWCFQNRFIKNNEYEEMLYFELLEKAIPKNYGLNIIHKEIIYNSIKEFEIDFENILTNILDKCKINYEHWDELKSKNDYPLKVIFMRPNDEKKIKKKTI